MFHRADYPTHTTDLATSWLWNIFNAALFFCLGLAPESLLAATTSPTALTFYAVEGASNPPNQTFTVSREYSDKVILRAFDDTPWLSVSPKTSSMQDSLALTVTVNTTGMTAGTYTATISVRIDWGLQATVPVTLIVSPQIMLPPSSPPPTTTTAVSLAWDPVNDSTLYGYKVYVGTAPGLYTRTITIGNIASCTVDGLSTGIMYYFVVTAYNSAGESLPSNEVNTVIY